MLHRLTTLALLSLSLLACDDRRDLGDLCSDDGDCWSGICSGGLCASGLGGVCYTDGDCDATLSCIVTDFYTDKGQCGCVDIYCNQYGTLSTVTSTTSGGSCEEISSVSVPTDNCTFSVDSGYLCQGACSASSTFKCQSATNPSLFGCAPEAVSCCPDGGHVCPKGYQCDNTSSFCTPDGCGPQTTNCTCLTAYSPCPDPLPEPPPQCCPSSAPYTAPGEPCFSNPVFPDIPECYTQCGLSG